MVAITLGAALGTLFLYMFFRAVQLKWPESYFGATAASTYAISRTPIRFAVFRFAPVFLACLFVSVSVDRAGENGIAAGVAVGLTHLLITSGRALWQAWRWSPTREDRVPTVLVRITVGIGVGVATAAAVAFRSSLETVVPPLTDISSTIWTALIAGVAGGFIVRATHAPLDYWQLAELGAADIPLALWALAEELANEFRADVTLVRAAMVAENLQRPHWFRVAERLKGRVFPAGTYGIMQISSDAPLSDEASMRAAVAMRFVGVSVKDSNGFTDYDAIARFAKGYNRNPNYPDVLHAAYGSVASGDAKPRA